MDQCGPFPSFPRIISLMFVPGIVLLPILVGAAPPPGDAGAGHEVSNNGLPAHVAAEILPEHRILALAQQGRWDEVLGLCGRLEEVIARRAAGQAGTRRYGVRSSRLMLAWARHQAGAGPSAEGPTVAGNVPIALRHPLIENLSKESYNLLSEFDAAISGGELRHACRLITQFADPQRWGLLRDSRDPRLLVDLPIEIELAMQREPRLPAAMQEHFGQLGILRVRGAIALGDERAVEAAAWRFFGSQAAAEARQWLGDRRLSLGRFVEAVEHYGLGLYGASPEQSASLAARSRLAAALLGFDVGPPADKPVRLGELTLSPERFEQLVGGLRSVRAKGATLAVGAARSGDPHRATCPRPAAYKPVPFATIDLRADPMPPGVDWVARQGASAVVGGKLLLVSTGQRAAFDLATGERLWLDQSGTWNSNPWWLLGPTQPIVDRDRIYVREVTPLGYRLLCLEADAGRTYWSTDPELAIASDPLLIGDDLVALEVKRLEAGELLELALVRFDAESGQLRSRVPVAEFLDHRHGALPCGLVAMGNRLVATAAGTVFCCDFEGEVLWMRRQLWMPPVPDFPEAALWHPQVHKPPLVLHGLVFATQPGVWAVEGLDLRTGRLLWRTAVPGLVALAGHYRGRLIVESNYGLSALDPATGRFLWHHPTARRLAALACGPPGGIVYARLEEPARTPASSRSPTPGRRLAALLWLDPTTGKQTYHLAFGVPDLEGADPLVGPLLTAGNRQWILVARADRPAERQIVELVARAPIGATGDRKVNN